MRERSAIAVLPLRRWTRVPAGLVVLGLAVVAAAGTWWALVFGIVVSAGVLSLREAGQCLVDSSGLCQAIAELCTRDHPLGVRVYSPELLWAGLVSTGSGLMLGALAAARPRATT